MRFYANVPNCFVELDVSGFSFVGSDKKEDYLVCKHSLSPQ